MKSALMRDYNNSWFENNAGSLTSSSS